MTGSIPVFDREDLLARVMGNERLLRRVVEAFNADMPRMLVSLAAAFESQDAPAARLAAHSIKGVAGNASAMSLAAAACEIEMLCAVGDLTHAREWLPRVAVQWQRYVAEAS